MGITHPTPTNSVCNIIAKDKEDRTPLIIAAQFGVASIVELLIQAGADIKATDDKGNTAFSYVAHDAEAEALELEKELGTVQAFNNLQQLSKNPSSELQETVNQFALLFTNVEQLERSRRAEVAKLLIKAGVFI